MLSLVFGPCHLSEFTPPGLSPVKEGRTGGGGSLARFTDEKNNESRITDIEISFSRITKRSTLYPVLTLQIVFDEIKID